MHVSELPALLRRTARSLLKTPTVAGLTIVTIALVICGVALIASIVIGVVLDPGPYREPDRVLGIQYTAPSIQYPRIYFPLEDYEVLRQATTGEQGAFEEVLALGVAYVMMTGTAEPAHLNAGVMPARTFTRLGVAPLLGRVLTPDDDRPGAPPVLVIGEEVWRQSFGSDPAAVGRVVRIDGVPHTIVGVMPPAFTWGVLTAWMPMRMDLYASPTGRFVQVAAWLKPGMSEARARDQVQRVLEGFAARGGTTYPRGTAASFGHPASPMIRQDVRQTVWLLAAAVGLLAAAGCVNVAALLLARAMSRLRDLGIRVSLGASRARLAREQLVEVFVLGAAGTLIGVALAHTLLPAVLAALPGRVLPPGVDVRIDARALVAIAGALTAICALCGALPALLVMRTPLEPLLRQGAAVAGTTGGTRRLWQTLIGLEMTVAMSLLVLTGVFIHSVQRLESTPLGYSPDRVVQLGLTISPNRHPSRAQRTAFLAQVADQTRAMAGVDAAAIAFPSSPRSMSAATFRLIDGGPDGGSDRDERAGMRIVGADFHRVYQIPIVRGRGLTAQDERAGLPVALVNETFAARYGVDGHVVGRRVAVAGLSGLSGSNTGAASPFEIVGVTRDVPNGREPGVTEPEIALPFTAASRGNNWFLAVRATGEPTAIVKPVQRAIWRLDPGQAFRSVWTEEEMLWTTRFGWPRFRALVLTLLGGVALALATAGAYGIVAYLTAAESRAIGIRLALGAVRQRVVRHVIARGLRPAIVGIAAGAGLAAAAGQFLRSFTGAVSPWDPLAYAGAAIVLTMVTALACYLPARRAARLDPLRTLKGD
jgi:putative ABC transport system permease protein